jgi:uncharacterized protein YciI
MSLFAVTRRAGRAWAAGGIYERPEVNEHAAFMSRLADEGFLLFAGPLAGSEQGRVRVLLIVEAEDATEINTRFAADPWTRNGQLVTSSVEPWLILVGADRLPRPTGAATAAGAVEAAHLATRPVWATDEP